MRFFGSCVFKVLFVPAFLGACTGGAASDADGSLGGQSATDGAVVPAGTECGYEPPVDPGDDPNYLNDYWGGLADLLGNTCSYALERDNGEVVVAGSCLTHMAWSHEASDHSYFAMNYRVLEVGAPFTDFSVSFDFAGAWEAKAGFDETWVAGETAEVHINVDVQRRDERFFSAPDLTRATEQMEAEDFVNFQCSPRDSDRTFERFRLQIDSAQYACDFETVPEYRVHGSLEADCHGYAGPHAEGTELLLLTVEF